MTRFAATWLIAVTLAALALFYVSHRVERLEEALASQQHDILKHQEAIVILEAEWSYLNRPERISSLAERFLALAPLSADRVVSIKDLPQRPEPEDTDGVPGLPSAGGLAAKDLADGVQPTMASMSQ